MSFLWHGLTDAGAQVPIQVDAQGRVIAVDGTPGVSNWERTGTTLSPAVPGDDVFTSGDVKVGNTTAAPNISLNADGTAKYEGTVSVGPPISNGDPYVRLFNSGAIATYIKGTSGYGYLVRSDQGGTEKTIYGITASGNVYVGGNISNPASALPNVSLNADGSATFAGNVTAPNITFRSSDPSYYAKTGNYSGPEVSLLDELVRLEALVNHLYQELGVVAPSQITTKATNLMKLRISSTQGKKKQ